MRVRRVAGLCVGAALLPLLGGCLTEVDCDAVTSAWGEDLTRVADDLVPVLGEHQDLFCDSDGAPNPLWIMFDELDEHEPQSMEVELRGRDWVLESRETDDLGETEYTYTNQAGELELRLTVFRHVGSWHAELLPLGW